MSEQSESTTAGEPTTTNPSTSPATTAGSSSVRPRWVRAAIGGAVVGVLAIGIAVALTLGGDGGEDPRPAAAGANVAAPSTPSTSGATTTAEPTATPANVASRTITVTGQGTATVKPDQAVVQIGVNVQESTADAALQQANESAAALIEALKGAGVADDDIVTSNLSIWPQYGDNARVTGYTASNSVSVTVRDIDRTGPVIDAAAQAAGSDIAINGISFGLNDPEAAMATARADAMANAAKRAGEFATAAGAGVGMVLQISETAVNPYIPTMYSADRASATTVAGGTAPTPIQPGTTDVSVTVNVVYALT